VRHEDEAGVAAPRGLPGAELTFVLEDLGVCLGPGHELAALHGACGEPAALAERALSALADEIPGDPLFAFDAYLLHLRETGRALVLLIDDLDALPEPTLRWLAERLDVSGGALRVLARVTDERAAEHAMSRLGLAPAARPAPVARPPARRRTPRPARHGGAWEIALTSALLLAAVALALRAWSAAPLAALAAAAGLA
jgi:hypothetical protein